MSETHDTADMIAARRRATHPGRDDERRGDGRRDGREREIPPERQAAARRQIRTLGDPVLREHAKPVTEFDADLAALSQRMITVMQDAPGVGLAAPQVGVVRRMITYQVDDHDPVTLVNPEIVSASEESEIADEGCLSVPGVTVAVERSTAIRVRAQDVHGTRREFDAIELEARVIQHETDHLDGILILERASRVERARAMRELREADTRAARSTL